MKNLEIDQIEDVLRMDNTKKLLMILYSKRLYKGISIEKK